MQKDYMKMAQEQGINPASPPTPGSGNIQTVVDNLNQVLQELQLSDAVTPEQIQELAQLIVDGNEQAIAENKLYQMLSQTMTQLQSIPDESGAAQPPADFAGMVPQGGGDMSGR